MITKLLFVCLGNICRSPTAEGVMQSIVTKNGMANTIWCDSAGTAAYHVGEKADSRMRSHAAKRGYDLTSRARQFDAKVDFEKFDLILTMDEQNYRDILIQDPEARYSNKVHRMTDYCQKIQISEVPDPYYGGDQGFEFVIDILEDACSHLFETILVK